MNTIKFKAIRDVKSPVRDGKNAGYDLFVPKFAEDFLHKFYILNENALRRTNASFEDFKYKVSMYGCIKLKGIFNVKIPSGLLYKMEEHADVNKTYEFHITNKSGIASKYSVMTGACVCDMEYRDEVIINIIGLRDFDLRPDMKIVQGVIREICIPEIDFTPYGDNKDIFSADDADRGGGFSSTGIF